MKSILFAIWIYTIATGVFAAGQNEGDCSVVYQYNFTGAQRCTDAGLCSSHASPALSFAGVLFCGPPWGDIFRVCFQSGQCTDGKVSVRSTTNGDEFFTSILSNPKKWGAFPKKFTMVMSYSVVENFPNQLVMWGEDPQRYTELFFGEFSSASLTDKGLKAKANPGLLEFLARPKATPGSKE